MAAQWVIPGRPEGDEYLTGRLQQRAHDAQDSGGVAEMFEGVHGNDNVRKFPGRGFEDTMILNPGTERILSCLLEKVFAVIDADDTRGPSSGHLHGIDALATTEVDNDLTCNPGEDFIPQVSRELRFALVSGSAEVIRLSGRDSLEDSILNIRKHFAALVFLRLRRVFRPALHGLQE